MMRKICYLIIIIGLSYSLFGCNESEVNTTIISTNEGSTTSTNEELGELTISNIPEQLVIKYGEKINSRDLGITATDEVGNDISNDLLIEIEDTSDLLIGDHDITLSITIENETKIYEINLTVEDHDTLQDGVNTIIATIPEYEQTTVDDYFKVVYVAKAMMEGIYPPTRIDVHEKVCPLAYELHLSIRHCRDVIKDQEIPDGDRFFHENGLIYLDESKTYLVGADFSSYREIPDSVTTIGDLVYANHKVWIDFYLPEGIKVIGDYAFYDIEIKGKFNIPDSVEVIGNGAFLLMSYHNASGETINVPDNLISVGKRAFAYLPLEENIILNENIEYIGEGAFSYAYCLDRLKVPDGNPYYQTIDDVLYDKDLTTIIHYPRTGGTVTDFPSTITTISSGAFRRTELPIGFIVPNTITKIGADAFSESSLDDELILPTELEEIGNYAFYNIDISGELNLPSTLIKIGAHAFDRTNIDGQLFIPNSVKIIGGDAFNSTLIESLILGDSVEQIHSGAFSTNSLKGTVIISDSVIIIGREAFYHSRITTVVIGENVVAIDNHAFPTTLENAYFKGLQAPTIEEDSFDCYSSTLVLYYKEGAVGFDAPVWQNFTLVCYND